MRLCRSACVCVCVCVCVSARKGHYFCVRACRLSDTGQRAPVDHASTPTGIPDVQQETRSWHASNCVSLDVCVCVCVCARAAAEYFYHWSFDTYLHSVISENTLSSTAPCYSSEVSQAHVVDWVHRRSAVWYF